METEVWVDQEYEEWTPKEDKLKERTMAEQGGMTEQGGWVGVGKLKVGKTN